MKNYQNVTVYYDETNYLRKNSIFQFIEDPFNRNAPSISKNYHEVILVMNFLHTKLDLKSMNIIFYDLYYTVIKNRKDKELQEMIYYWGGEKWDLRSIISNFSCYINEWDK